MSRSRRKAIVKDVGHLKRVYWRIYRRVNSQIVKNYSLKEWVEPIYYDYYEDDEGDHYAPIPEDIFLEDKVVSPKQLINDYDYSDYRIDYQYGRKKGYYFFVTNSFQYKEKQKEMEEYASKLKRK